MKDYECNTSPESIRQISRGINNRCTAVHTNTHWKADATDTETNSTNLRRGAEINLGSWRPVAERGEHDLQSKHPLQTIPGQIRERRWRWSDGGDIE